MSVYVCVLERESEEENVCVRERKIYNVCVYKRVFLCLRQRRIFSGSRFVVKNWSIKISTFSSMKDIKQEMERVI